MGGTADLSRFALNADKDVRAPSVIPITSLRKFPLFMTNG